ncbi:MAG: T9SS type A sorting domain-containing protein [Candidatus Zhuqueibacterota bacterium]
MKIFITSIVLLPIFFFASNLSAQKYAILKPTTPGVKSDVIPISKKQLKQLLNNETISLQNSLSNFQLGVPDTISHYPTYDTNFGVMSGDTLSSYYELSASLYIRAVGITGHAWGSIPIAEGFHLMIHKRVHPWYFPTEKWNNGGCPVKDSLGYDSILGEKLWGNVSVPIIDGERVWTEMGSDVFDPGEGFIISIVPYGGNYMGNEAMAYNGENDGLRLAKYYQLGWGDFEPQWVVRNYSCAWLIVVEIFGYPPVPWLNPETYGTVLNSNPKPLRCHIWDLDAQSPDKAGIDSARLFYKINDGDYSTLKMYLVSGTDIEGTWEAVLPAGYMDPGDVLTYEFQAVDKSGHVANSGAYSFRYFKKMHELLVFYNDDGTSYDASIILHPYYDNLWVDQYGTPYSYDAWIGLTDGPLTPDLINQYNYLVQIDAYSPAWMNDDVVGAWFESGELESKYRCLFWSSQDWAGFLCGGWEMEDDTTFAPDDWHYKYLGIEYIGGAGHDIATDPFPINPVKNDWISGELAEFIGDSLKLYLNCKYELGFTNWADAFIPTDAATVCFTDSAQGRAMGIHKFGPHSSTVFLSFDQLCLQAQPGDYWTEPNITSVVGNALRYFTPINSIENCAIEISPSLFILSQNYPNPFNAETCIRYTITEPARVQVGIYNIRGQQVAELVNEKQSANSYAKIWDAGDCPSGVYFCRIQAGDFSRSIKMILIR